MSHGVLPRAGAILEAYFLLEMVENRRVENRTFVQDEYDDVWSVCVAHHEPVVPVQRHTSDGWVAAIFHRGYGYIKIVAPGDFLALPQGQSVVARVHRGGVRWEFADPPSQDP
jgi:hypothetical protein